MRRNQFVSCLVAWTLAAMGMQPIVLPAGHQLILCGGEELYIMDFSGPTPKKLWSWKAKDRPELPADMRDKFKTIDECKPTADGKQILITASSNGAAVIERATGKVRFHAMVMNAHSIEMLPRQRVVVAASHSTTGPGDRLIVYDLARSNEELLHVEASWAHGVVWDEARSLLWALSNTELVAYQLTNWDTATPSLTAAASYPLPDRSGHDLMAAPQSANLTVTTGRHVWLFDRQTRKFQPHPALAGKPGVKAVHAHPTSQREVWTLSEGGHWWTDKIRLLSPEATLQLPGEVIYKARWIPSQ